MKALRNFIIDAAVLFGFLIVYEQKITSETIHEWLGLAVFVTLLTHLLLHWKWVVDHVKSFFRKMALANRVNFVVDFLFFVAIIGVTLSGVMMSKSALPALGISLPRGGEWKQLHSLFADACLYLLAIHFAMHWTWITCTFKRYLLSPLGRLFKRNRTLETVPVKIGNN